MTNLLDKTLAVFWLIYLFFKHWFNMEKIQAELDRVRQDLDERLEAVTNGYIITWDIFQTNCFWFEPKNLCKSPDGNGTCHKKGICPILWRLKRV